MPGFDRTSPARPSVLGVGGKRIRTFCRNFIRDDRGVGAAAVAVSAIGLIGFVGLAADAGRAYMVKSRLSSAVDSAALVGGQLFFEDNRDERVEAYFEANFPPGFMNSTVSPLSIVSDDENETLTLSASATIPTSFMKMFDFEDVTVYANAEVTRKMRALDLVLAIDISGSMDEPASTGVRRIDAAKDSAKELIGILYGSDSTKELLQIGLVPWSSKVNVMRSGHEADYNPSLNTSVTVPQFNLMEAKTTSPYPTADKVWTVNTSPVPLLLEPPAEWKGCVYNRFVKTGSTDIDDGDIRLGPYTANGAHWPGWTPVLPGDYPDTNLKRLAGEPVSGSQECKQAGSSDTECDPCPPWGITALQHERAVIEDAVDAIEAITSPPYANSGNTNIPAGLAWAWEVVMPASPFTEGQSDLETDPERAIVLLTDGENCASYGDGYLRTFGNCGDTSRGKMNERLKKLATNVKESGVIVYAIQFAEENPTQQALMKEVASGPEAPFYHFAPDAEALKSVFTEIANHLSQLRLSK
jgi:Flp pilus assembly protein TadG